MKTNVRKLQKWGKAKKWNYIERILEYERSRPILGSENKGKISYEGDREQLKNRRVDREGEKR